MHIQNKISNDLKYFTFILNQIFEIEKKVEKLKEENSILRNLEKLKEHFETSIMGNEIGLSLYNPIGEKYNETRTDCEASIAGSSIENLVITEVIKPVIRVHQAERTYIIQKAVVIVESNEKVER